MLFPLLTEKVLLRSRLNRSLSGASASPLLLALPPTFFLSTL